MTTTTIFPSSQLYLSIKIFTTSHKSVSLSVSLFYSVFIITMKKVSFSNYILCYPTQHSFFYELKNFGMMNLSSFQIILSHRPTKCFTQHPPRSDQLTVQCGISEEKRSHLHFVPDIPSRQLTHKRKENIILEIISSRARQTTKQQLTIKIEITKFDIDE